MTSIFRIPLSELSSQQLDQVIQERCDRGEQTTIATVNPEILLRAKKDEKFAETLRLFSIRTVDGFGISLVLFLKHRKKISRLTGRTIVDVLLGIAKKNKYKVGLLGGKHGVAKEAARYLQETHGINNVVDLTRGEQVNINEQGSLTEGEAIINEALQFERPEIVLVGFGAPKQERWIQNTFAQNKNILIAVGVGGILDVFSGRLKSPPDFFARLGLEWLWRLLLQPKRLGRIFNAVIVFTFISLFRDQE